LKVSLKTLEEEETPHHNDPHPGYHFTRSTKNLEFYTIDKEESGESLKINLIDSVGYGDSMELDSWLSHITAYIESGVRLNKLLSLLY